ncbi:MAG: anaerobic ribonucleoside-triphosphate reductase [Promethearchaeota archaeon]
MDSDKNNFLEKHLKILGQKIRIDIIKKLKKAQNQLTYSKLQKEVLEDNDSSVNFSFHLNALKKYEMINSSEDGYFITDFGTQILESILSIERILMNKSKTKMIRTSKYSKELFDTRKIEEYLSREGGLETFLARQIAREVEKRLAKTNIEYLTTPLMREYINAILLENGLEDVRHRLTRLGTPPYEASKLFNLKEMTPDKFIKKLGSDVSEQFLLLNLIPKKLADLYLSGEIALLHLNYWSLRPLSIYIKTDTVLEYIFNKYSNISNQLRGTKEKINLILHLFDFLYQIKPFSTEDIILGDFGNTFLSKCSTPQDNTYMINLLTSQILRYNNSFQDNQNHLTLEFNSQNNLVEGNPLNSQIDRLFLDFLNRNHINNRGPSLVFGFSDSAQAYSQYNELIEQSSNTLRRDIIFYNNNYSNLLNSTLIKINNPVCNKIILDKILINLHLISVEANQNDDLFFELLQNKLNQVFELFNFKVNLVKKKLTLNKEWETLSSIIFGSNKEHLIQESLKSISFFGLNKAVTNHCGIELDRTDDSLRFALEIFTLMQGLIEEQNEKENDRFMLSQPHDDKYLSDSWRNESANQEKIGNSYSSRIIRENSPLPLTKKIKVFRKFENLINGGTIFKQSLNSDKNKAKLQLKTLFDSKINAISFNNNELN